MRLKELNLGSNIDVTPAGWQSLFRLLQRPSRRLESIKLNLLTDKTVESLASVLSMNSKLKELELSHRMDVTPAGWQILVAFVPPQFSTEEAWSVDAFPRRCVG